MESVVATRILSSRPRTRTMTARPSSSARPITTTGLVAPRTGSRARSGLRRQIQDKTYWMGILRAKMNELTMEISRLSQECEVMSKDESRIFMWRRKAETLAHELTKMTMELSIYNEYLDRVRAGGEDLDSLREDIQEAEEENRQSTKVLETKFKEKKEKEKQLESLESELLKYNQEWQLIKKRFSDAQRQRYDRLESLNQQLTMDSTRLEEEIMKEREKKNQLEGSSGFSEDAAVRKKLMKALDRVRELEKQKSDLILDSSGDEERSKLLAQIKRDSQEISSLESQLINIKNSQEAIQSTLLAFEDIETAEKFKELKRQETSIDEFMREFHNASSSEQEKLTNLRESISELHDKCSHLNKCIDLLKESGENGDSKMSLIDERRKLQLDWSKIQQLESKIAAELDSLRGRIETMSRETEKYSDLARLREELNGRGRELDEERKSLNESMERLKKESEELVLVVEKSRVLLEENDLHKKISLLEEKLSDLAAINEDQESKLRANDNKSLKKQVFDMVNRYNQSLLGF